MQKDNNSMEMKYHSGERSNKKSNQQIKSTLHIHTDRPNVINVCICVRELHSKRHGRRQMTTKLSYCFFFLSCIAATDWISLAHILKFIKLTFSDNNWTDDYVKRKFFSLYGKFSHFSIDVSFEIDSVKWTKFKIRHIYSEITNGTKHDYCLYRWWLQMDLQFEINEDNCLTRTAIQQNKTVHSKSEHAFHWTFQMICAA